MKIILTYTIKKNKKIVSKTLFYLGGHLKKIEGANPSDWVVKEPLHTIQSGRSAALVRQLPEPSIKKK
jgi:hypothetical protein